jgi:hypothetical protein
MNPLRSAVLVAAAVCVSLIAPQAADAAAAHVSITEATLLSGGLTDCPTPNSATCRAGIASALALVRNLTAVTPAEPHFLLCEFDRQTPFVQMHPLGWGVNTLLFDYFGLRTATVRHSFFTSRRDIVPLTNGTVRPLLANVAVNADNGFYGKVDAYSVDATTGIAYIRISEIAQPNSINSAAATAWATLAARRDPRTKVVVIGYDDMTPTATFAAELKQYIAANDDHGRMSMPDVILSYGETVTPAWNANYSAWIGSITSSETVVSSVRIQYDDLAAPTADQAGRFIRSASSAAWCAPCRPPRTARSGPSTRA